MNRKRIVYHHKLRFPDLRYPRDVMIWLTHSYKINTRKRYPVLYFQDGQNMIDPATSFLGVPWALDRVSDRLIRNRKIEEFIAVGIYNTRDRDAEYSGSNKGRTYARFVVEKLKPLIDARYRTKPGPAHTATLGSSMGGLIAFLFAWWHPNVFSKAACVSGAFVWNHNAIPREVERYRGRRKKIRIYLDCGSKGTDQYLKPGFERMFAVLASKGYRKGSSLQSYLDPKADHNERDWSQRLWRPLTFLFGKSRRKAR